MTPSQRQVFHEGEGDAWFQRNRQADADQGAHWTDQDSYSSWGTCLEKLCRATTSCYFVFVCDCAGTDAIDLEGRSQSRVYPSSHELKHHAK